MNEYNEEKLIKISFVLPNQSFYSLIEAVIRVLLYINDCSNCGCVRVELISSEYIIV
jgi:hypothetical protein